MAARLLIAALALTLAQCAALRPGPEAFAFAVMGDTPYNAREEAVFLRMIERINRESVEFVVHVGDITGNERCTDALYEKRRAQFDRSEHPFVYTPGDNEWVDCRSAALGGFEPVERLARLRGIFFAGDDTLGQRRFTPESQRECVIGAEAACVCPRYVENRAWTLHRVRFVTLNYAGQDNNVGHGAVGDGEARCRNEANRRWLERAFRESAREEIAALVVMTQANPWFTPNRAFDAFIAQLTAGAAALRKPLLFVHGDTHLFTVDEPIPGVTRLETHGSPFVGWVRVEVDPSRPNVFTFHSQLEAIVLP
jgi:hypothetical protein